MNRIITLLNKYIVQDSCFYQALSNTPLQQVLSPAGGAQILAKYEFVNPFGSVKDHAAFSMFCEAINLHDFSCGSLKLLDASSGNMGKALAKLGQLCGIPIHLILPDTIVRRRWWASCARPALN